MTKWIRPKFVNVTKKFTRTNINMVNMTKIYLFKINVCCCHGLVKFNIKVCSCKKIITMLPSLIRLVNICYISIPLTYASCFGIINYWNWNWHTFFIFLPVFPQILNSGKRSCTKVLIFMLMLLKVVSIDLFLLSKKLFFVQWSVLQGSTIF